MPQRACPCQLLVLLLILVLAFLVSPPWAHSYYNYMTSTQQNVMVLQQTIPNTANSKLPPGPGGCEAVRGSNIVYT